MVLDDQTTITYVDHNERIIHDAKKIAKNTGIFGGAEIFHRIVQFVSGIIITRVVGASIYGIYTTGITVLFFLQIAGTMGLSKGVVRYIGLYKREQDKATGIIISGLLIAFLSGAILAGLLYFGANYLANSIFCMPTLKWVLQWLAASLPASVLIIVGSECIRGFQNIKGYVVIQKLLLPLGSLILIVCLFLLGFKLRGLVLRDVVVGWLVALVTMFLLYRTFPGAFQWKTAIYTEIGDLVRFSLPLAFAEILFVLLLRIDVMMIAAFLDPQKVGIYGVVLRLARLILTPLVAIDAIVLPILAEYMGRNSSEDVQRIYKLSVHWALMMVLPIFVISTVYSEFLLGLFGEDFIAGSLCFIIIACGYLTRATVGSISGVLLMGGKSRLILYNMIIFLGLNIPLNFILIRYWGITGVAFATGLIMALHALVMLVEAKIIFDIQLPLTEILKFMGIGSPILLLMYMLRVSRVVPSPTLNFIVGVFSILILYGIGLIKMRLITMEDKAVIGTLLSQFRK